MRPQAFLSFTALALALAGCGATAFPLSPSTASSPPLPESCRVLQMFPEAGPATDQVRSALERGDVVVLAIFTKQTPASEPALSTLGHLTDELDGGSGLTVVALNDGKPLSAEQWYANDAKYKQTVAAEYHPDIADQIDLPQVPLVIILDREGIVRYVHTNLHDDQGELLGVQQEILALSPKSGMAILSEATGTGSTRVVSKEITGPSW